MRGRPSNPDRKYAIEMGERTYIGSPHDRCGTDVRYASGGGCVHCARVIATEQREARKFLRMQEAEYRELLPDEDETLDNSQNMVVEPLDDPEARRQSAIDDLM